MARGHQCLGLDLVKELLYLVTIDASKPSEYTHSVEAKTVHFMRTMYTLHTCLLLDAVLSGFLLLSKSGDVIPSSQTISSNNNNHVNKMLMS